MELGQAFLTKSSDNLRIVSPPNFTYVVMPSCDAGSGQFRDQFNSNTIFPIYIHIISEI